MKTGLGQVSTTNRESSRAQPSVDRGFASRVDAWKRAGFPRRQVELLERRGVELGRDAKDRMLLDIPEAGRAKCEAAWGALEDRGGCVLLLGPRGTGKTALAADLALRAARSGLIDESATQQYAVLGELFREEKRGFSSEIERRQSPLDLAARVDLLVLDDIHERFESVWEDREFVLLFDRRYREMRRTILCANFTLHDAQSKIPGNVWSRIVETGVAVECDWPSFRGPK